MQSPALSFEFGNNSWLKPEPTCIIFIIKLLASVLSALCVNKISYSCRNVFPLIRGLNCARSITSSLQSSPSTRTYSVPDRSNCQFCEEVFSLVSGPGVGTSSDKSTSVRATWNTATLPLGQPPRRMGSTRSSNRALTAFSWAGFGEPTTDKSLTIVSLDLYQVIRRKLALSRQILFQELVSNFKRHWIAD